MYAIIYCLYEYFHLIPNVEKIESCQYLLWMSKVDINMPSFRIINTLETLKVFSKVIGMRQRFISWAIKRNDYELLKYFKEKKWGTPKIWELKWKNDDVQVLDLLCEWGGGDWKDFRGKCPRVLAYWKSINDQECYNWGIKH